MESTGWIALAAATVIGASLLVLALWSHKRAGAGDVKLIGEEGRVETKLEPEGTVIVAGELWRAKSVDSTTLEVNTRVRIVGMQGHLVVVELSEPPTVAGGH